MRANYEIDVRHVLPTIQAPTLILHRVGDRTVPVEAGRYLAQHIPGAKHVELPGDDHLLQAFDQETMDLLIDETEELITGARSGPEPCLGMSATRSAQGDCPRGQYDGE
jgi:pimeloyl-ACP methyl ester carboxylesterase